MKQIHLALAVSLSVLAAPAALMVASAPLAAQPGTGVSGTNVVIVTFAGGHYAAQGGGKWGEYDAGGQQTFAFVETGRDEWSVYLNDPSRNVQLQLDLFRRKISYGTGGGPRSDLYDITGASSPPVRRSRNVNAGPIWNQADAQMKCPVAAYAVDGHWTGQWSTVREGQMSVCEIAW